ncbi:cupin domain-containing protein [Salinigranum rubrum]|uniref:cupin domain-containing protein n=1 Tax=Salinigranum rubrum TaxID=755307 RepID=UPI000D6B7B1F|nr:cupin domain-containing protein [Salinigranum rubrum]
MATNPGVSVVGASVPSGAESDGQPTTEALCSVDGFELCRTRLSPGASSGWHHHGEHTVYGVVLDGRARLEFGPGDADGFEVGPGDFFRIPATVVHREVSDEEAQVALVGFAGAGPLVVDADSPEGPPAAHPRVAGDADLVPTGMLKGLTRLTPFPDAAVQQVRGHAAGAVESNWHHHGDNHVFGYVVEGEGYMEWGTGPDDRALVRAGECFHLSPEVVHRDVNPRDADQRYLLWLTGSEPRTVPAAVPEG